MHDSTVTSLSDCKHNSSFNCRRHHPLRSNNSNRRINKAGMRQARLLPRISMSGGTLDADNSLTVSGALTQSGDIDDRCTLANKTLTYTGAALSLGAKTLTMSGGWNIQQHKCLKSA